MKKNIKTARYFATFSESEVSRLCSEETRKMKKVVFDRKSFVIYTPIEWSSDGRRYLPCKNWGFYEFRKGQETALNGCKLVAMYYGPAFPEEIKKDIEKFKVRYTEGKVKVRQYW